MIKKGSDTFLSPKKVKATGLVVPCKMPKPVKAGLPVMKDDATCHIQYLDVDQGMSSSYVICMLGDKTGNLWFGTNGGGVSKYDGKSFTHFTEKQGLSNNTVWSIIETPFETLQKTNLYFATEKGLSNFVAGIDGPEPATKFIEKTIPMSY